MSRSSSQLYTLKIMTSFRFRGEWPIWGIRVICQIEVCRIMSWLYFKRAHLLRQWQCQWGTAVQLKWWWLTRLSSNLVYMAIMTVSNVFVGKLQWATAWQPSEDLVLISTCITLRDLCLTWNVSNIDFSKVNFEGAYIWRDSDTQMLPWISVGTWKSLHKRGLA